MYVASFFGLRGTLRYWLTGLLAVVKWRGVGVHLSGTSVWQGQLYLQRRRRTRL